MTLEEATELNRQALYHVQLDELLYGRWYIDWKVVDGFVVIERIDPTDVVTRQQKHATMLH